MPLTPTDEQACALDLFATGDNLAVEAGAGTGKTSTLQLMAASTTRTGQYVAFNRAIVDEADRKMPSNVSARTIHSLAFRAIGKDYSHRLDSPRMTSAQIARILGIDPFTVTYGSQRKVLQPGQLAGMVMRALDEFCKSADPEPGRQHFAYVDGIDLPTADGRRTYGNNNELQALLEPKLRQAWADATNVNGRLRYAPARYLKQWQLSEPVIACDFLLFDEAQDVSPVMLAIVEAQAKRTQLVFVGDSQQSIYGWNGAVDAMSKLPDGFRSFLTQSFRFGPAVADVANTVLTDLEADLRIKGLPSLRSTVGKIADGVRPDAVLCRTNAGAVSRCLEAQAAGVAVYLAGGGDQVIKFAEGAADLQAGRNSWHPELSCFTTWGEVQDYVEQDELGGELALLVDLVDKFTPEAIISGLRHMPDETKAELTVTTAHKSKGREWNVVQLADDFGQQARPGKPDPEPKDPSDEEKRLLYVAVTRAQQHLDISQVPYFMAS